MNNIFEMTFKKLIIIILIPIHIYEFFIVQYLYKTNFFQNLFSYTIFKPFLIKIVFLTTLTLITKSLYNEYILQKNSNKIAKYLKD